MTLFYAVSIQVLRELPGKRGADVVLIVVRAGKQDKSKTAQGGNITSSFTFYSLFFFHKFST